MTSANYYTHYKNKKIIEGTTTCLVDGTWTALRRINFYATTSKVNDNQPEVHKPQRTIYLPVSLRKIDNMVVRVGSKTYVPVPIKTKIKIIARLGRDRINMYES